MEVENLSTPSMTAGQAEYKTPHGGTKRRGDDSIDNAQRLSKRFDLLNLEQDGKLWTYPPGLNISNQENNVYNNHDLHKNNDPNAFQHPPPTPVTSPTAPHPPLDSFSDNSHIPLDIPDSMQVDDTKHRIYIHNLDEELSSTESNPSDSEDRLVFLPDIEKRLNKIPQHVLQGENARKMPGHELVLYKVPSSLTVPEEEDSVRKAIIEARKRARERRANDDVGSRDALLHDHEEDDNRAAADGGMRGLSAEGMVESGYEADDDDGCFDREDSEAMDIG